MSEIFRVACIETAQEILSENLARIDELIDDAVCAISTNLFT